LTKDEFRICFDQYFNPVRNYIAYRCGDEELATDIAQECFMKLWKKNMDYHPQRTGGLLYKMAKDLWISQYRKMISARKYELTLSLKPGSDDFDPQQAMELNELKAKYEETLTALPEKQREVFLMSRMEDLTYREIAERLDITVKAVEKRMSVALQILRKTLTYG
jgi:RNA polymerase sigma-70 factor (ECF subfamily)